MKLILLNLSDNQPEPEKSFGQRVKEFFHISSAGKTKAAAPEVKTEAPPAPPAPPAV